VAELDLGADRQPRNAFLPKPSGFSGSTYPTSISSVRITGDPKNVETVAGLLIRSVVSHVRISPHRPAKYR
jgi:hypothetical protein